MLHDHDQHAVEWAETRREILDQIQQTHDLLWDLDCFRGRQPARPGEPPLPPTSDDPIYLKGRRLRTACLALLRAHGRRSLPELHTLIHLHGYAVSSRAPTKALADAMALEVRQGRVLRPKRGHYEVAPGYRPLRRHRSAPTPLLSPIDPLLHWYPERWWPAEPDTGIGEDVVDRLEPDGQTDELRPDTERDLVVGGEVAVRGRGGVDGQAADVTDVGPNKRPGRRAAAPSAPAGLADLLLAGRDPRHHRPQLAADLLDAGAGGPSRGAR